MTNKTPENIRWKKSLIVDIDLDFWEETLVDIPLEVSIPRVKDWIDQADFLTFATSPFFVEQERALSISRKLLSLEENI